MFSIRHAQKCNRGSREPSFPFHPERSEAELKNLQYQPFFKRAAAGSACEISCGTKEEEGYWRSFGKLRMTFFGTPVAVVDAIPLHFEKGPYSVAFMKTFLLNFISVHKQNVSASFGVQK